MTSYEYMEQPENRIEIILINHYWFRYGAEGPHLTISSNMFWLCIMHVYFIPYIIGLSFSLMAVGLILWSDKYSFRVMWKYTTIS